MIKGLNRIALSVRDIDRSISFCVEALGSKLLRGSRTSSVSI